MKQGRMGLYEMPNVRYFRKHIHLAHGLSPLQHKADYAAPKVGMDQPSLRIGA